MRTPLCVFLRALVSAYISHSAHAAVLRRSPAHPCYVLPALNDHPAAEDFSMPAHYLW